MPWRTRGVQKTAENALFTAALNVHYTCWSCILCILFYGLTVMYLCPWCNRHIKNDPYMMTMNDLQWFFLLVQWQEQRLAVEIFPLLPTLFFFHKLRTSWSKSRYNAS